MTKSCCYKSQYRSLYVLGKVGTDLEENEHYLERHLPQVRFLHGFQAKRGSFPVSRGKGGAFVRPEGLGI